MIRTVQTMFLPVADFLETFTDHQCYTTHPLLQEQWNNALQQQLKTVREHAELTVDEWSAFQKVESLFTTGLDLFLKSAVNRNWRLLTVEEKKAHIEKILNRPQIPQRTLAWYQQAQTLLTASEFASLFGSERTYANLVLSKAMPQEIRDVNQRPACLSQEMTPFDWGIRFEPLVKMVFSRHWNVTIGETGRIVHSNHGTVAASPDGIIIDAPGDAARLARLLEIKCPISRPITKVIPFDYWCQMQIQMEVADVDECEYLEVKIESAHARNVTYNRPANPLFEGNVWLLANEMNYQYAYTEEEKASLEKEGWHLFETIPWAISNYFHTIVQRDYQWFQETQPVRDQFWTDVEKARQGTFVLPPPLPVKQKKAAGCLIQDSPPEEVEITSFS